MMQLIKVRKAYLQRQFVRMQWGIEDEIWGCHNL